MTMSARRLKELKPGDHLCSVHEDAAIQLAVAVGFIQDGLTMGEHCVYITSEDSAERAISVFAAAGIELSREKKRGALQLVNEKDAYFESGVFSPRTMIGFLRRNDSEAIAEGFAGARIVGNQTAPLAHSDSIWIEYEAVLNRYLTGSRSIVLCQYHRPMFPAALMLDILRTHPLVILDHSACSNPYFEPPKLLLNPERMASEEYKRNRVDWWISQLKSSLAAEEEQECAQAALKEAQERLRQSQKMESVGRLAAGVAHDFNNHLTVILGCSELLGRSPRIDDDGRGLAEEIKTAGERAASLTRQLLAFSRKQVLAPKALDINEVVRDTGRMLRRVIGEDVRLVTTFHPQPDPVMADSGQLEQVLLNLAVNARDAMPKGGTLSITTENVELDRKKIGAGTLSGSYVALTVTDSGSGMPEDVKNRAFEPFFTTKEPGKGTGLGLAVVQGIVQQSGGEVKIDSAPGKGTSVKIYLPRAAQPASSKESAPHGAPLAQGTETVLLVEDDESVRSLIRRILRECGYTVLEAGNGEEALRTFEKKRPIHLLVTDVVMPVMGGRPLAERLLSLNPEMKVLYLSGYTDDEVMRQGIQQGRVNFLQKPFTQESLTNKIREVLASKLGRVKD